MLVVQPAHHVVDRLQANQIGPEHRAAAITREAVAVDPDDVDVAGPLCQAFVEDLRPFVDQRIHAPLQDLLVGDLAPGDPLCLGDRDDELLDLRVSDRCPAARLVAMPAGAGLLPETAQLADPIGHGRIAEMARPGCRLPLADPPADVEPRQVAHGIRAHRHAEVVDHRVDLLGERSLFQQEVGLPAIGVEHPVADEAVADADQHADLPDRLRQLHDGRDGLRRGLRAAHVLHQLHHVRRAEEVGADDLVRPAGGARDLVDVECRGVAGQDCLLLAHGVQLAEHLLLEPHLLEHRLDDDVNLGQVAVVDGGGNQAEPRVHRLLRQTALRDGRGVVLRDDRQPLVERLLRDFEHRHRDAGVGEVHRDAATHRAAADDRRGLDREGGGVLRDIGNLRDLAFGEERMALRLRLVRGDEPQERLALGGKSLGERLVHRRLDAGDARVRRLEPSGPPRHLLSELPEDLRRAPGLGHFVIERGRAAERPVLVDVAARAGDRRIDYVALDHLVDHPERLCLGGRHHRAAHDHIERRRHADQTGQALRAARSRDDAERHLRQPDPGAGRREPHVTAERQLEAAPQRHAVDGGDDRLLGCFEGVDQRGQMRGPGGRGLAEFADVGAGAEHLARPGDNDRAHRPVSGGRLERGLQAGPHGEPETVDRRIVERDDGYAIAVRYGYCVRHRRSLLLCYDTRNSIWWIGGLCGAGLQACEARLKPCPTDVHTCVGEVLPPSPRLRRAGRLSPASLAIPSSTPVPARPACVRRASRRNLPGPSPGGSAATRSGPRTTV